MRRRLFNAWEGLFQQLRAALAAQIVAPDTLQRLSGLLQDEVRPVAQDLLLARNMGAAAMHRQIAAADIHKDFSLGFHFNRLAPAVQDQADQYAAQFVREIGEDTRSTLAATAQSGVTEGLGPEELAQRLRDSIGLTTAQARAVQNYRRLLVTGSPEALTRALRDRRYDVTASRLAQLTPNQIDARVDAYRRRYVMYRANTIARYETLYASNAGSISAVQSAIKTGALPASTVKTWKIAKDERTCERCRSIPEIQPRGVGLDQPFIWQTGKQAGEVYFAPLHPDCRCTHGFLPGKLA